VVFVKIIVINPNTNEETTRRIRAESERTASTGTVVEAVTGPFGARVIKTLANGAVAANAVMTVLAENGSTADAAIIAAFSDPGLRQAKASVPYPVIGIGEASMLEAATLSDRFSIVTMGEPMVDYLRDRAVEYGVGAKLARVRILPWSVRAARQTDIEQLVDECLAAIRDEDAGAIIIGGGPLAGLSNEIANTIKRPVLDGTSCAIRLAERRVRDAGADRHTGSR
jgi:allantoin racemase